MTEYTQRDRDDLRKVLIAAWYRQDFGDALTAILASEWLAEHDRQVAEAAHDAALAEAADLIGKQSATVKGGAPARMAFEYAIAVAVERVGSLMTKWRETELPRASFFDSSSQDWTGDPQSPDSRREETPK